jgi:hypothetical protein
MFSDIFLAYSLASSGEPSNPDSKSIFYLPKEV